MGDVAIALATQAGLVPEPWQADGLRLMMALRADGKWAAYEYAEMLARQQGKTGGLLTPRALTGFLVLGERLIMWSAHLYATAMESFLLVRDLLRNLGEPAGPNMLDIDGVLIKISNTNGDEGFERLDTGARLKFLARSKSSGRGFTGNCNLIDEAFAFTRAQQAALFPTMTAVPNAQVIYASTPPLDKWSGDVLFGLRARALAGGDGALAYRDWGVEGDLDALMKMPPDDRAAILDDRRLWAAANPAVGRGRVTEESILRNRRSLSEEDFAREVLGIWPLPADEVGGLISRAAWTKVQDRESQFVGRPVFAIDASQDRSTATIALAGRRADGVAHIELMDDRPGAGMGWVVDRAVDLHDKAEPLAWVLDPTGPAGALIVDLQARGIDVVLPSGREYVQACAELFDAVQASTLRHRGQEQLDAAINAARSRAVGDGAWAWARRSSAADIGRVAAVTLAHHGLLVNSVIDTPPTLWL